MKNSGQQYFLHHREFRQQALYLAFHYMYQITPPTQSCKLQKTSSKKTSSSGEKGDSNQIQANFYKQFVKWSQRVQLQIHSFSLEKQDGFLGSQFINFYVEVNTDHLTFSVKKRYSQFRKLYQQIQQIEAQPFSFPKKTFLSSKTNQLTTEARKNQLNDFLNEAIKFRSKNDQIIIELLRFVDLKTHYDSNKLSATIFSSFSQENLFSMLDKNELTFTYCVNRQLQKLNIWKEESIQNLNQLEKLVLTVKKFKVKSDDLRIIFLGDGRLSGLFVLSSESENQLVSNAFLKTISSFLNPEKCAFTQTFKLFLESVPSKFLKIPPISLSKQCYVSSYFFILSQYLQVKSKSQVLLKQILGTRQNIEKYLDWKKNVESKSLSIYKNQIVKNVSKQSVLSLFLPLCEKILPEHENRSKAVLVERPFFNRDKEEFINIVSKISQTDKIINGHFQQLGKKVQKNKTFIAFISRDSKSYYLNAQLFKVSLSYLLQVLNGWAHNRMVCKSYSESQPILKVKKPSKIWMKIGDKQEKLFKVYEKPITISEDLMEIDVFSSSQTRQSLSNKTNCFTQVLKKKTIFAKAYEPIDYNASKSCKEQNSFFCFVAISEIEGAQDSYEVDIAYYFHQEKVRKYLKSQLQGKSNNLFDGFVESLYKLNSDEVHVKSVSFETQSSEKATSFNSIDQVTHENQHN